MPRVHAVNTCRSRDKVGVVVAAAAAAAAAVDTLALSSVNGASVMI